MSVSVPLGNILCLMEGAQGALCDGCMGSATITLHRRDAVLDHFLEPTGAVLSMLVSIPIPTALVGITVAQSDAVARPLSEGAVPRVSDESESAARTTSVKSKN